MKGIGTTIKFLINPKKAILETKFTSLLDCIVLWGITIASVIIYFYCNLKSGIIGDYHTVSSKVINLTILSLSVTMLIGYFLEIFFQFIFCKIFIIRKVKFMEYMKQISPIVTMQFISAIILRLVTLLVSIDNFKLISVIIGFILSIWAYIMIFFVLIINYQCPKIKASFIFLYVIFSYIMSVATKQLL